MVYFPLLRVGVLYRRCSKGSRSPGSGLKSVVPLRLPFSPSGVLDGYLVVKRTFLTPLWKAEFQDEQVVVSQVSLLFPTLTPLTPFQKSPHRLKLLVSFSVHRRLGVGPGSSRDLLRRLFSLVYLSLRFGKLTLLTPFAKFFLRPDSVVDSQVSSLFGKLTLLTPASKFQLWVEKAVVFEV